MKTYKELDYLGFFDWYCGQYGGLVYSEYKSVYDDLPLDNLIRTELNACIFKWFRGEYGIVGYCYIPNESGYWAHSFENKAKYDTYEEAELECINKLIEIVKEHGTNMD
jgi:hypothetical protein